MLEGMSDTSPYQLLDAGIPLVVGRGHAVAQFFEALGCKSEGRFPMVVLEFSLT
jgi:hypothetical protein